MLKKLQKKHISLIAFAALFAFSAGAMVSAPEIGKFLGQRLNLSQNQPEQISPANQAQSTVFALGSQSRPERAEKLEAIANGSSSPDRERARYLLASDLIETRDGEKALSLLQGLEKSYPSLGPYILLKQAQAQDILGESGKASDLRQRVLREYPEAAGKAKALYMIALPEHHDTAIAQFPSHPLTWEIIYKRLQENPNQPQLRLILAQYAYNQAGIVGVLDQLIKEPNLKPEEWEIVGTAYWENNQFAKAGDAYFKAPPTSRNLYRAARGIQIGGKEREKAIATYNQLIQQFPDARETGLALLRLSELARSRKDALPYLDRIIANFPQQASTAVVEKAKIYQGLNDQQSAQQTWELLLGKYASSNQAAEYRWNKANEQAKAKNYAGAWQWAQPIATNNPNSILAPRAGFWVGKWALTLGKQQEAKAAYEYVLSQFPYSYYAWRSAANLGLNVGNFDNVRQLQPEIVATQRPVPPAGSDTFKELYLLGEVNDAWLQWETEFLNKLQPTVAEQFTEGLMRLARGNNLSAISLISRLEDRETPEEQAEYQALSKEVKYWQARYPFPYRQEIKKWSAERQLNPLLVTGLMRQESMFEPKIKSVVGATGLMQVMPATGEWIAPQINLDSKTINLEDPNENINLGTWYLDFTHRQYDNNSMLAIASYNAGPGNVSKWLRTIGKIDPDDFVEDIPFNETKNYVRQVFGNYWNYLRLYNPEISAQVARYSDTHPQLPQR
ncbi:transglycosylase SLT domain-containing protein [Nodularia sphaerocarpa]|uniref:lytic transglycosylase domain-containing protein n=1 Tax=Nodularia sphaerocarpa TaxID=137816 RepID=UPI001EFC2234|nr:transglycosylase SLT domain-containing protein [Nodularia sphaerocarpa]MDB9372405.1 transglycosylase SLT domain-containing protein [Nodularia sphaerocarpa CS-585]MDB9379611.1 transglycosylase SLT domain-containing protein [Nodularia sphaerocarpa CS-585A2]ULP71029.1 Soluble lytic murein transglycosylase [Nodularia sphaerocarpa UHCC 0038]